MPKEAWYFAEKSGMGTYQTTVKANNARKNRNQLNN